MSGVQFTHPNPLIGDLFVRIPPTLVEWTYNLNTNVVDTYGGQVVQLLSINYDRLIIEGQFGIEGPHGRSRVKTEPPKVLTIAGGLDPAIATAIRAATPKNELEERPTEDFFDLNGGRGKDGSQPYEIGLTQMTAYFQNYFEQASQGMIRTAKGNLIRNRFDQEPMQVYYASDVEGDPRRDWTGYPVAFPSYSRSNEEFAPKWRIEFEVEEPDTTVAHAGLPAALKRLRAAVGYKVFSPFSDPLGASLYDTKNGKLIRNRNTLRFAHTAAEKQTDLVFDELGSLLPSMNESDLRELIQFGASRPHIYAKAQSTKPTTPKPKPKRTPKPKKPQV